MGTYQHVRFAYRTAPEVGGAPLRRPVAVVGAGPVGLAAAIDLALHGVPSVVLDDNDSVSVGSRAICWSKRTLEIFDRLGVADRMLAKGVTWRIGRVFHRDRELYCFDLLPEGGHKMPAFINLQQYYVEQYLVERALEFPQLIDLRWKHRVAALRPAAGGAALEVDTPDGRYAVQADWVLAADGARSTLRGLLGLPFEGHTFEEKFLIADVQIGADFPSDRRFWFEPVFGQGQSVLIHRQPDNIFRIDFQLGPDADADLEMQPERVMRRVRGVVGPDVPCELDWCSVYSFRCARLDRFVHGRVVFVGDSAHVVSPFGARGGNGGIQDVDNVCWKLAQVLAGRAPERLLESYDAERVHGADENIRNSRRTTAFMTPKTGTEKLFRDGVLALAHDYPFARLLVNSGRLSRPCSLEGLPGFEGDGADLDGPMRPGMPCLDAPVTGGDGAPDWLLRHLGGHFTVLSFAGDIGSLQRLESGLAGAAPDGVQMLAVTPQLLPGGTLQQLVDAEGLVRSRYGGADGVTYLIRPDQHVTARWARPEAAAVGRAWRRSLGEQP
ncbi:MAG: FAD-dependent oxidoreductase [Nevskia sp.]|nr:FAD-dependent oxidoreductase [Nevskia sp.]